MTKDKKILEILKSKPKQKIGLDDFYGRQTVLNMLNEAINYTHCCTDLCDVMAMFPTESQLDEIAFKKYGNDPDGAIKFNLVKRMAFIEGCEFMLRLINSN